MSVSKHLQDKLALLPDSPGCYIMKDENQNILYVGKAKVLKNRVRSYFHGTHNNKTTRLVSHIRDFEFIVTGSEKEALLLEINLIKKHTPPYNIMFMDDKTYPYIEITKENNFVVRTTRNIKNKKSEYFGPYPSSQSAYEIVKLINQIFCVRKCRHIPDSPCLYYHMHQCLGPCIHEIDPKENEVTRKKIKKFLQGDTKEVMDSLQAKMMEASENLQFEKAQEIYNTIQALEHVIEKQTIDFKDRANRDVFGYYVDSGYISFQGFFIRQGKLLERNMSITPLYEDEMDAFTSFIMQYYEKNVVPKEILVPSGTPVDVLKEALNTNVHIPVRGEKKKLIDLVYKNAKEAHEQKFKLVFRKDNELRQANEMLSKIFNADIHTVEMFDNSHIQGTFNVSGLVVFKDGLPDKNSYRHYKLDGYRSDVDSMKEVIYRRYFRLLKEHLPMPDLLLVDGGAAQIAASNFPSLSAFRIRCARPSCAFKCRVPGIPPGSTITSGSSCSSKSLSASTGIFRAPTISFRPIIDTISVSMPARRSRSTTVSPSTSSKPSARYTFTLLICILLALRIMKPVDFRPANMYIHILKFHFPSIIKYIIIYKELLIGYGFTNLYLTNVTIPSHNYM